MAKLQHDVRILNYLGDLRIAYTNCDESKCQLIQQKLTETVADELRRLSMSANTQCAQITELKAASRERSDHVSRLDEKYQRMTKIYQDELDDKAEQLNQLAEQVHVTTEERSTRAQYAERIRQLKNFIEHHRNTYQSQRQQCLIERAKLQQSIVKAQSRLAELRFKETDHRYLLEQIGIMIPIVSDEVRLSRLEKNMREQKKIYKTLKNTEPKTLAQIDYMIKSRASVNRIKSQCATLCETIAGHYERLAASIYEGDYDFKLMSAYKGSQYRARRYDYDESRNLKDFYSLADNFSGFAREYELLNYQELYEASNHARVSILERAIELADSQQERASVYLKMAKHYYAQALSYKYVRRDDLSIAGKYYKQHEKYVALAKAASEDLHEKFCRRYTFLERDVFFKSMDDDPIMSIHRSMNYWFNPYRFIKTLVDFNRRANQKENNDSTEDMFGITARAMQLVLRGLSSAALIHLDRRLRNSYGIALMLGFLNLFMIEPKKAKLNFSQQEFDNFGEDFKTLIAINSPKHASNDRKITDAISVLCSNLIKLIDAFLGALKNELDNRQKYLGDYEDIRTKPLPSDAPPLVQHYYLSHVIKDFTQSKLRFLAIAPGVDAKKDTAAIELKSMRL